MPRFFKDAGTEIPALLGRLFSNWQFMKRVTSELAPRVGVPERGFVGSCLLGVEANSDGPSHSTPAGERLTLGHRDFLLYRI